MTDLVKYKDIVEIKIWNLNNQIKNDIDHLEIIFKSWGKNFKCSLADTIQWSPWPFQYRTKVC